MTDEIKKLLTAGNYEEALNKSTSAQEEDEVFEYYFDNYGLLNYPKVRDRVEIIKDTFKEELIALGFNETENPFIIFVNKYFQNNPLNIYQYNVIHNLFASGVLDKNDLTGKSKDGWDHIIFNPSLYEQDNKSVEYIIKLDEWLRENEYSFKTLVTSKSVWQHYNNFEPFQKEIYIFRNDLIYEEKEVKQITPYKDVYTNAGALGHMTIFIGGKPGTKVNKAEDIKKRLESYQTSKTSSEHVGKEEKRNDIYNLPKDIKPEVAAAWKDKIKIANLGINKNNIKEFIAILKQEYLT